MLFIIKITVNTARLTKHERFVMLCNEFGGYQSGVYINYAFSHNYCKIHACSIAIIIVEVTYMYRLIYIIIVIPDKEPLLKLALVS